MALTAYKTLYDQQARPMAPGPYCVYDVSEPEIQFHSTLSSIVEMQTQKVIVSFAIHARSTAAEDGLEIAVRLAESVASAYDQTTPLDISPDIYLTQKRLGDLIEREGEDEWVVTVRYEYLIDAHLSI